MRIADAECGLNQRAVMFEVNKLLYIRFPNHIYGIGTVILQAHNVSYFLHVKQFAYRTSKTTLVWSTVFAKNAVAIDEDLDGHGSQVDGEGD